MLFVSFAGSSAWAAIPASERQALIDFYNATGGPNWVNHDGWLGEVGTECQWFGVFCDADGNHVVTLLLYGNRLVNFLPDLSPLQMLEWVDVNGNELVGSLPPASSLPNSLKKLMLTNNEFSGSVPDYSSLPTLETLYIGENKLSGPLPTAAQIFYVKDFEACGPDPDHRNQFEGSIPQPFAGPDIERYCVSNTGLTGNLPKLSGDDYPNLAYFYAEKNNLTGSIPNLDDLSTLKGYNVGYNLLTGQIPSISNNSSLARFWVGNNKLTGPMPDISGNDALKSISVENNQLTGNFPSCSQGTQLQQLLAGHNGFRSMSAVSTCTALIDLNISFALADSGEIPDIGGMSAIKFFVASNNGFTGNFPNLPSSIYVLDISHNNLSGAIPALPERLWATTISSVDVSFNSFTGSLPPLDDSEGGVSVFNPRISKVCPNDIDMVPDSNWDIITNTVPWYQGCANTPIFKDGFDGSEMRFQ